MNSRLFMDPPFSNYLAKLPASRRRLLRPWRMAVTQYYAGRTAASKNDTLALPKPRGTRHAPLALLPRRRRIARRMRGRAYHRRGARGEAIPHRIAHPGARAVG